MSEALLSWRYWFFMIILGWLCFCVWYPVLSGAFKKKDQQPYREPYKWVKNIRRLI